MLLSIRNAKITAGFHQMRPLDARIKTHEHGAVDLVDKARWLKNRSSLGAPIEAPESGTCFAWMATRPSNKQRWLTLPLIHDYSFEFANYFYDVFGAVIFLVSSDKERTHVIAHSYGNQLFNNSESFGLIKKYYVEEKRDIRFPVSAWYTAMRSVGVGEVIGFVGNAGYSRGAHVHHEVHNGCFKWNRHSDRIDIEEVVRVQSQLES